VLAAFASGAPLAIQAIVDTLRTRASYPTSHVGIYLRRAVPRAIVHSGTRAPTRIDFGGGWTDVPPYSEREGGFVCNLAIARYATVLLAPADSSDNASLSADRARDRPLVEAAVRRAGISGADVALYNDFPVGAGLGGSSAAGVALADSLSRCVGEVLDPAALAERSRATEVEELGIAGGRQDHYASAFGGALALRFSDRDTKVHSIPLTREAREELEQRCIVVYTGESRISGDTITAVTSAYEKRDTKVLFALRRMKELAEGMARALECADIDELAALVGEHWAHQRSLHPAIPTNRIDAIIERARAAGALGAKALGASGGGCVLLIARRGNEEAVASVASALGPLLPFAIAERGVETFVADAVDLRQL
jgi:D-glycero-alpha-D-manno-heptose-7-phosphate kinase